MTRNTSRCWCCVALCWRKASYFSFALLRWLTNSKTNSVKISARPIMKSTSLHANICFLQKTLKVQERQPIHAKYAKRFVSFTLNTWKKLFFKKSNCFFTDFRRRVSSMLYPSIESAYYICFIPWWFLPKVMFVELNWLFVHAVLVVVNMLSFQSRFLLYWNIRFNVK